MADPSPSKIWISTWADYKVTYIYIEILVYNKIQLKYGHTKTMIAQSHPYLHKSEFQKNSISKLDKNLKGKQ